MRSRVRLLLLWSMCIGASVQADIAFELDRAAPGNLRFTWIHGSVSAKANTDVRIQVHRYNEHTYILRQNPAVHWEAPFMYLLLGNRAAVLLDAGATEEDRYFPLRRVVDRILERWKAANGVGSIPLIVLPLGSDASQTAALAQFGERPDTRVVLPIAPERRQVLGATWPDAGRLDLGGRVLQVMPTPGLDDAAISVYDPWSRVLFTGNAFYPGRLVIRDFDAYRASLQRLAVLTDVSPVQWIWGGRIEMTSDPGADYLLRANYRPNEHALQLSPQHLADALQIVRLINGTTDIRIHDDFIVMHGVGRGARDYGWPVYVPEQFRKANTR
jgi:glyoxylase-like metal-dependent hydrolase (beta-lactamase superfamily II)